MPYFLLPVVDELPTEASFDAEVALGDVVVLGGGGFYDFVVLDMEF